MLETNENDNTGAVKVEFLESSLPTIVTNEIRMYVPKDVLNIHLPQDFQKMNSQLTIYNTVGEFVFSTSLILEYGETRFVLPENLPTSLYFININNNSLNKTIKSVLGSGN